MNTELETFFKDTPLGIKSVLQASVHLAEKVNSRTDLSGKEKTELVVKSLTDFLGEGNPELVALVGGVVPGVLEIVISTARGKYMLKQVTSCLPSGLCGSSNSTVKAVSTQDPMNEVPAKTASVWALVRSAFFRAPASTPVNPVSPVQTSPVQTSPVSPVSPAQTSPVTTIREPDSAPLASASGATA